MYSRKDALGEKVYYFAWSIGELYSLQVLNAFFQPAAEVSKTIDADTFAAMFVHEPGIQKYPKGEAHRILTEGKKASSKDAVEGTLRELFRKALVRIKRTGSVESSLPIIRNLLEVQEGITEKHKHMFSEFGVELRKNKCYPEAMAFAQRTLVLSQNDDHAHFNVARILIDMGDYDEAEQHLLTAQYINPDSRIYKKSLQYISLLRLQNDDLKANTSPIKLEM